MNTTAATLTDGLDRPQNDWLVIGASSLGTVFEWYDFYLYGLLAAVIGAQFFSGVNEVTGFIFALAAFAAGFAVRPFGALVFGRLGRSGRPQAHFPHHHEHHGRRDLCGRRAAELCLGRADRAHRYCWRCGCCRVWRWAASMAGPRPMWPSTHLRAKRGFYTSWIQTTATLGLFAALLVVLGTRTWLGEDAFKVWGWRIPFILSVVLLAVSLWIRMQLAESPVFLKMKSTGTTSRAPLREAFGNWSNLKIVDRGAHRRRHGAGGDLVLRTILCAVLLGEDSARRWRDHEYSDRHSIRIGHAFLRIFRVAIGQDRQKAHHSRGLSVGDADLFSFVPGVDPIRQSGPV